LLFESHRSMSNGLETAIGAVFRDSEDEVFGEIGG